MNWTRNTFHLRQQILLTSHRNKSFQVWTETRCHILKLVWLEMIKTTSCWTPASPHVAQPHSWATLGGGDQRLQWGIGGDAAEEGGQTEPGSGGNLAWISNFHFYIVYWCPGWGFFGGAEEDERALGSVLRKDRHQPPSGNWRDQGVPAHPLPCEGV